MKEDHKKLVDDPEEFPWDGYVQSISDLYLNPTEDNLWERMDDNIFMWLYSKGVYSPDEMKDVMEKTLALDEFEDTQSDFDKIV
jgi:hypothetical protein